jgi:hypothetical protein
MTFVTGNDIYYYFVRVKFCVLVNDIINGPSYCSISSGSKLSDVFGMTET